MKTNRLIATMALTLSMGAVAVAQCTASGSVALTGNAGEVLITDNSTTGGGGTYSWVDFYNNTAGQNAGYVSMQPNTTSQTYTFTQNGTYTYYLQVEDSLTSCYDSIGGTFVISGLTPLCDANFTIHPDSTNSGSYVFNSTGNNASTASYYWDFGNGNTGSGAFTGNMYNAPGNYYVCLTVTDTANGGCTQTYCDTVIFTGSGSGSNPTCDATFYSFPDSNSLNAVTFYSVGSNNGSNATYAWNYGDGNNGTGATNTHTYATAGWYAVCLTVSDATNGGCTQTYCDSVYAQGAAAPTCDANFLLLQDSTGSGVYYAWNNSNGSNLNYFWDFGDGGTSTSAFPSYTYGTVGTYTICLTVWNGTCSDTVCQPITITVKANGTTLNVLAPGQTVGVEESEAISSTKLYPNPTNGNFVLEVESTQSMEVEVLITNLVGQTMNQQVVALQQGSNKVDFYQTDLTNGIYLVHIIDSVNGKVTTKKLIKE